MPRINLVIAQYPSPIRIVIFLFILLLCWLPFALPIHLLFRDNPNLVSLITMVILYLQFLFILSYWSKKIYQNKLGLQHYGLVVSKKNATELLIGLVVGLIFTWSLFIVESLAGWIEFKQPSIGLTRLITESLLIGLGIGFAEELLFRGWLLDELERDYYPRISLVSNALLFAGLHFIKPLSEVIRTFPQFPALVILGLTLVWAKWSCSGRLGMSIGLHGGLVCGYYIIKVGELVTYKDNISPFLTGIDGNPLAGIMGLLFLSVLALGMKLKQFKQ